MSQTEILALWGAVTGTIGTIAGVLGLWLRFRQHGMDRPKLMCDSSFSFESPSRPTHKITIRSVGRRPVAIDQIKYFNIPRIWSHRLTKRFQHKKGRWVWGQSPKKAIKLGEGEKAEVSVSLPDSISITEIYKVVVLDQTGKEWPVKWAAISKLKKVATEEVLEEFSDENDKRVVSAVGHRLGTRYFLETKFNTKPGRTGVPSGRSFWFLDIKKYQEKLQNVKSIQAIEFLSGESEEIQ
jgi:hypothetical protein